MVPAQIAVPTYAALLPPGIWAQVADPFTYVAEFLPINAGQQLNFDNTIQNDSDFLLVQALAQVTSVDDQTSIPFFPATVQTLDQGAGRQLQSRPEHFNNVYAANGAGAAGLVHYLPLPKLIDRGSTFTTTVTSLFAATNVNVRISYQGMKLFGRRGAKQWDPTALVQIARALLAQYASQPGAPRAGGR